VNLGDEPASHPLTAAAADRGLRLGDRRRGDVLAVEPTMIEVRALANAAVTADCT
jgi:hypothetical protein